MSRKHRQHDRLPPFVPLFRETLQAPAYRQLSFGARALLTVLKARCIKNNGHVYASQREVAVELGHIKRNDIANWFRELQHYGFIVQTEGASLGVDGKGKAPHWRITDVPTRNSNGVVDATKDFLRWDGVVFTPHVAPSSRWNARKRDALKQNPGLDVGTIVDSTSVPVLDSTSVPLSHPSGTDGESISAMPSGTDGESITILATRVAKLRGPKRRGGEAA